MPDAGFVRRDRSRAARERAVDIGRVHVTSTQGIGQARYEEVGCPPAVPAGPSGAR